MRYRVYCDSHLIYDSNLDGLNIYNATVELELNKTGSFVFTVYPNHPYYQAIYKLKSIVEVYQDNYLLFRGRVLDEEISLYNNKKIVCEGELAFFLDTIQRPMSFDGTAAEYLALIINNHNSQVEEEKRFVLGSVTVLGALAFSEADYTTTQETLRKRLLDAFGGYLVTRHEDNVTYIDYLADINTLAAQTIEFGKNLIDMKRSRKGADIATAVIPLGAKLKDADGRETGERLTIASVNGGLDYLVDTDAKAQFGFIVKVAIFDDITSVSALMAAGQTKLNEYVALMETVNLTAADLSTLNVSFQSFRIGTKVRVTSAPHVINLLFLVSKLSINILDPAANRITLGKRVAAFSEAVSGISEEQQLILQDIEKVSQTASDAIYTAEQRLTSSIKQTEKDITSKVAETYYLKKSGEELGKQVSNLSTSFSQTSQAFEMRFDAVEDDVITMQSYIRYEGGNIILGEDGNTLTLRIENDRITFFDGYKEVAYFSNNKLYVTDAEFLNSLRLGNFAFIPRKSGNLSFTKVV